jgi:hypothetical protein
MSDEEKIGRAYYAIIPATVRYDKNLIPNAKLLYGEITALCNEKGFCWAGNSYFADLYSVTKKSISAWIGQLSENGFIKLVYIYKDGTKEILNRHIYLKDGGIWKKSSGGIEENFQGYGRNLLGGMEEKVIDNNTKKNNTDNNTEEREERTAPRSSPFKKPTIDEVSAYCKERGNKINPEAFLDFYESKGWLIGKNKMKDWRASIRTWERKEREGGKDGKQRDRTPDRFIVPEF